MAIDTVRWTAGLDFPDRHRDYELVSLSHPDEYPFNEGRIVSNRGIDITAHEYDQTFEEIHVAHSNALQARIRARGNYLVGPLARFALNFDKLLPVAAGTGRTRRESRRPATIPTRASSCAPSRCCTPARMR